MDRGRRAMPVGSKPCHEKYLKQCQDHHRTKLASMKSSIDNKPPQSMRNAHLKKNAKKQQIMEDRYAQIERDNRLLLEKMSAIMRKKGSGVDMKNESMGYAKSLNKESRKRELLRITKENQRILSAIQGSESMYDHVKWAEEAKQNERYMEQICEFPVTLREHMPYEDEDGHNGFEGSMQEADFEAMGAGRGGGSGGPGMGMGMDTPSGY